MEHWQLKQLQGLPLEIKIQKSLLRIREWYEYFQGEVYVAFSGGKDSTVLLDLVRSLYPDVKAVFIDTGLEYPEIKEFVKTYKNIGILKPNLSFKQVLDKYGYPLVSKEVSECVEGARKGQTYRIVKFNKDNKSRYNVSKWKYLIDSNIKISNKCCHVMKKAPAHKFEKLTGLKSMTGMLACESQLRTQKWLQQGCNSFNSKKQNSMPLAFWTEQDILQYLKQNNIPIAKVYGTIEKGLTNLYTTGVTRTGCMFCMFGCHLEKSPNRFQQMYHTYPQLWEYCINKLDLKTPLEFIGVDYKPSRQVRFNI